MMWDVLWYAWSRSLVYLTLTIIASLNFYLLARKISMRIPCVPSDVLFKISWLGLTLFVLFHPQLHIQKGWLYILLLIAATSLMNGLLDWLSIDEAPKKDTDAL